MPFRLKRKESVPHGLHRLTREEFTEAETQLRELRASGAEPGAIHEARKHLKKLRALCQVWRECVGTELSSHENAIMKAMARDYSAARDAEVRLALFGGLIEKCAARPNDACRNLLHAWEAERRDRLRMASLPDALDQTMTTLTASKSRFDLFPINHVGWEALDTALRRSYRRTRKAYALATAHPAQENAWHEWRKRAKTLQYQITLLERADHKIAIFLRKLMALTECLGNQRDLTLLGAEIRKHHPAFAKTACGANLLSSIKRQRARLKKQAARLGARLFPHKPRRFTGRIRTWSHRWR
jgi:CHAD domain-containing protein